jgi:hypothetical protein
LDLDVGMCHPAPQDDPDNHRVQAAAMAAAWSVYRAHGATSFIVSGAVNTADEVDLHRSQIPDAEWRIVRLRIGADERRRRTEARGKLLGQDAQTIEWWIEDGIEDETKSPTKRVCMACPACSGRTSMNTYRWSASSHTASVSLGRNDGAAPRSRSYQATAAA